MKATYHAKFGKGTIIAETELDYTIEFATGTKVLLKAYVILSDVEVPVISVSYDTGKGLKRHNKAKRQSEAFNALPSTLKYKESDFEKRVRIAKHNEIHINQISK